jgi:hypothetical protein
MTKNQSLILLALAAALLLGSCVSVNHLDEYRFEGSTMAPTIWAPEFADVHLSRGNIPGSEDSVLLGILEIGANVAVGIQEQKLETRLNEILRGDDLALALETEFVPDTAAMLGAMTVDRFADADYLLEVEVREYGLTSAGGVHMEISVDARIIHRFSGQTAWRRRLSVSEPASPGYFGINEYLGTAISVAALEQLSDEALQNGFDRLSRQAAANLSERFRRDYFKARSR